jgi:hypothetical protein
MKQRDTYRITNCYNKGVKTSHERSFAAAGVSTSLVAMAILIASFNLSTLNSASAATVTPQTLATKIAKAGLGCKTITEKTKMLFNGNRWVCVINGEKVSIEVYPAAAWKTVQELACAWEIGFIAITDNKTWMVVAESRATSKKLVKPLGGSLKVFCNAKNIYNEKKPTPSSTPKPTPTSPSPTPSSSPSPTPTTPVVGTWTNPYTLGIGVKDDRFKYTPVLLEQDVTSSLCTALVEEFSYGGIGDLCPEGNGSSIDVTNNSAEIARPGWLRVGFGLADNQGKIYRPSLTELTPYVEIDIVPGGTKRAIVYFQVPKTFSTVGARLEIVTDYGKSYWSIP